MYRHGGLFSVTSKILINDFLSTLNVALCFARRIKLTRSEGNVPVKLITGLVILHAER